MIYLFYNSDDKFARKIFDIQLYKELLKETNQKIEEYSGKLIILNKLLPEWTSHSYKVIHSFSLFFFLLVDVFY